MSIRAICLVLPALVCGAAYAQSADDELAKYRQMLADDNPADLTEAKGAELWKTPRGPKHVSLEQCDLGKGPGVVMGAYVALPRYFGDTGRVQDIESRLVTCMVGLQGIPEAQASKNPYASNSDMQALVAYVAGQSKGLRIAASMTHPKEKSAYEFGRQIFFYRAGPYDFSCASCHAASGKRIRLQKLVNLIDPKEAQNSYGSWPAYRYSQGELRTLQHRIWDCFRQQRFPEIQYNSEAATALMVFLAKNADGGIYNAPGIKR
ncbi:MAG TPA: sulfur oxidation c-type cytochrome SoxA [Burkholderiaceae bacterium]|nr:sulfur oxidation c-type cytochrome SoxA [Burkholderiaceae bacterium]